MSVEFCIYFPLLWEALNQFPGYSPGIKSSEITGDKNLTLRFLIVKAVKIRTRNL